MEPTEKPVVTSGLPQGESLFQYDPAGLDRLSLLRGMNACRLLNEAQPLSPQLCRRQHLPARYQVVCLRSEIHPGSMQHPCLVYSTVQISEIGRASCRERVKITV